MNIQQQTLVELDKINTKFSGVEKEQHILNTLSHVLKDCESGATLKCVVPRGDTSRFHAHDGQVSFKGSIEDARLLFEHLEFLGIGKYKDGMTTSFAPAERLDKYLKVAPIRADISTLRGYQSRVTLKGMVKMGGMELILNYELSQSAFRVSYDTKQTMGETYVPEQSVRLLGVPKGANSIKYGRGGTSHPNNFVVYWPAGDAPVMISDVLDQIEQVNN